VALLHDGGGGGGAAATLNTVHDVTAAPFASFSAAKGLMASSLESLIDMNLIKEETIKTTFHRTVYCFIAFIRGLCFPFRSFLYLSLSLSLESANERNSSQNCVY
jgi:hypothetical protein